MAIIDRLFRSDLKADQSLLENPRGWLYTAFGAKSSVSGAEVTPNTATGNTAVWNAIWILATTVASLPLPVFRREGEGKARAVDHPLYSLLHDAPNEYVTSMNYRVAMMYHMLGWGNHYAEMEHDRNGRLVALWPLPPDRVTRVSAELPYYRVNTESGVELLPYYNVLHIPGLTTDGINGISPIAIAREAVGLGLAIEEYAARFYANSAKPQMAIRASKPMSREAKEQFKADWNAAYSGLSNAHRTALLEDGMDVVKLGLPQEDAQFLESRRFQVEEVARIFNLPPHMLKEMSKATFSNIEQQFLEFHIISLRPWLVNIEQTMNLRLFPADARKLYFVEFVFEGLLRGDQAARGAFYKDRFMTASLTPNEIRAKENENPLPGGDELFYPANMIPMGGDGLRREFKFRADGTVSEMRVLPTATAYGSGIDEERGKTFGENYRDSAPLRRRVRESYHQIFVDAAVRAFRGERRNVLKARGKFDDDAFREWLAKYYADEHREFLQKIFRGPMHALAEAILPIAVDAVGVDPDTLDVSPDVEKHLEGFAGIHARWSHNAILEILAGERSQRNALLVEAEDEPETLEAQFDDWEEGRSGTIANWETTRLDGMVSKLAFRAAGVTYLVWSSAGSPCKYCQALDGMKVGIESAFVSADSGIEVDGEVMGVTWNVMTPPAHNGCQCSIEPGF